MKKQQSDQNYSMKEFLLLNITQLNLLEIEYPIEFLNQIVISSIFTKLPEFNKFLELLSLSNLVRFVELLN